jgi:hypothetical protein
MCQYTIKVMDRSDDHRDEESIADDSEKMYCSFDSSSIKVQKRKFRTNNDELSPIHEAPFSPIESNSEE